MVDQLLQFLQNNPWLNLVFLLLAIMGIMTTTALYLAGRKERLPVFNKKSFNLIKENISGIEGLSITFLGEQISNLTATNVAIWNRGKQTIDKKDVAPADPLRIEVDEDRLILLAQIIFANNEANNFAIDFEKGRVVNINFDYFYKNEGVVIRLLHTGQSGAEIKIKGTIMGAGGFAPAKPPEYYLVDKYIGFIPRFLAFIPRSRPGSRTLKIIYFILGIPIIIIPFSLLYAAESVMRLSRTVPKEFGLNEVGDESWEKVSSGSEVLGRNENEDLPIEGQ